MSHLKNNDASDRHLYAMMAVLILSTFALANMGCSAAGQEDATGDPFRVGKAEVWLAPTNPLYAAQKAWGLPAVAIPEVSFLANAAIAEECGIPLANPTDYVAGCTLFDDDRVLVNRDMDSVETTATLLHESGHYLARKNHHINSPLCVEDNNASPYTMCAYGSNSAELTQQDFDWALTPDRL